MRVIAGKARRILLSAPEGIGTRPTTDRTKETLFNMIQPYLQDSAFLDLFSGSGAIGIEAVSRGARKAVFVEKDSKACTCIQENLKKTNLEQYGILMKTNVSDALGILDSREESFDVVFMDPPYNKDMEKEVLFRIGKTNIVKKDTIIIVEASLDTSFVYTEEAGFSLEKEKKYKTNKHVFLRVK